MIWKLYTLPLAIIIALLICGNVGFARGKNTTNQNTQHAPLSHRTDGIGNTPFTVQRHMHSPSSPSHL